MYEPLWVGTAVCRLFPPRAPLSLLCFGYFGDKTLTTRDQKQARECRESVVILHVELLCACVARRIYIFQQKVLIDQFVKLECLTHIQAGLSYLTKFFILCQSCSFSEIIAINFQNISCENLYV